jgi:hypothetical protein
MTTLMQAHEQWAKRPADERFVSLHEMQAKMRTLRERSEADVQSTRKIEVLPDETDLRHRNLTIGIDNGPLAGLSMEPTHWSFGQLCSLASPGNSPATYFRDSQLPAPVIADCLNYNLRFTRGVEDIGVLLTTNEDGGVNELRSVNGPNYGRVYDADVVDALVDRFGDGITGTWRVPGEFGQQVAITKANTTLFASDRDMFVFLADEENRIELPNRRAGRMGSFARGFFVGNSEVANFGVSDRRFRFKPAGGFGGNRQAVSVQSGTPCGWVLVPTLANRRCVIHPILLWPAKASTLVIIIVSSDCCGRLWIVLIVWISVASYLFD